MTVLVGLNVWSRLVEELFPSLDQVVGPFDSLWFPDHVQYAQHKVAAGWSLLAFALARYPDKVGGHDVLCNSFRNPAHLAKMAAINATTPLELDINIGMVHFDALQSTPAGLTPAPLCDAMKTQRDNRYLIGDEGDNFSVTAHGS